MCEQFKVPQHAEFGGPSVGQLVATIDILDGFTETWRLVNEYVADFKRRGVSFADARNEWSREELPYVDLFVLAWAEIR